MATRNMSFQLVFFFFALFARFYHLEAAAGFKSNVGSCIDTERRALLKLKEDLIDPFGRLSSWIGEDCCNWSGVGCSNQTGNVVMLDLSRNYDCPLDGDLSSPYWFCKLGGTLNPSLLNLTHLNYLDVSSNNFLGTPIPDDFIGSLKNLKHLDLNSANFSGTLNPPLLNLMHLNYLDLSYNNFLGIPIPNFIGSLKNLKHLDLKSANFSGLVPPHLGNLSNLVYLDLDMGLSNSEDLWVSDLDWLSRLSSLQYLNLRYVNLSKASTNWLQAINMLPSLLHLYFSSCQLHDLPQTLPYVNFTLLQKLDLSYNKFGSPPPHWLFNFTTLVELRVRSSNLTGPIPKGLEGNLCNLQVLDLSSNSVEGEIAELIDTLSRCGNGSLETLDLSMNKLQGTLPDSLWSSKNLTSLSLSYNKFTGKLSDSLGSLAYLEDLILSNNLFSGPLPKSLGNLSRLGMLDLSFNMLSGTIPEGIGQLSRLFKLRLYGNPFEGVITELHFQNLTYLSDLSISSTSKSLMFRLTDDWIPPFKLEQIAINDCLLGPAFPSWLRTQSKISEFTFSDVGISDTIPDWFWRLVVPTIWWLDLSHNQLRGKLPTSVTFPSSLGVWISFESNHLEGSIPLWSNVTDLLLKNNLFSGPIPSNIGHEMSLLQNLDLSGNFLTGSIPPSINNMTNLNSLDLSSNKLSGTIPRQWQGLLYLMFLDLSKNNLSSDHIPSSMCSLPSLSWLKLSSNNLGGELSTFLQDCKVMFSLDLGENKFTGSIPESNIVATESPMALLSLRGNMLTGSIPEKLCQLFNLHILDLALNSLSGSIPSCLGSLPRLKTLSSYFTLGPYTQDVTFSNHMELVIKGRESEFTKIIRLLNTIDLSCNNLVGEIPEEITNLSTLGFLNFSWNQLTGRIPENLVGLQRLEALDLSHNHLSGQIPPSISKLTFLNHLNLSYNSLSGQIPSSNQLQTIGDPSIYEGNPGLCGPPLPISCSISSDNGDSEDKDDDKSIGLEFYISAVLGFLVAFWAILGTLVINKSIRYAYFGFLDRKMHELSVLILVKVARLGRKNGMERN